MHAVRFAFAVAVSLLVVAPVVADPEAEIMAAHEKMVERGKFRLSSVTEGGGQTSRTDAQVEWPDRYHMKIDAGGQKSEMIILPSGTWMRQGGQWMKLPMDMGAMIKAMTPEAMRKAFEGMTNLRQIGSTEIAGRAATGYAYDSRSTMMGVTSTASVQIWIDDRSGLPLRQQIDGEAMGTRSKTVQDYDFDSPVSVRAPD